LNHAGIGKINKDCNVYLPVDLISPLSIVDDVMIWGIFYPPTNKYDYDLRKKANYDFVLSPIPFDLWGKVGRLKIRLKNIPGAHEKITKQIYDTDGSILISEASRSAHSYDTWTIVITFDDLDKITYDEKNKIFIQTQIKFNELKENILNNCNDVIYIDKNDQNMKEPLRITSYNALSYFYNIYENKPSNLAINNELAWTYYTPFCLSSKNNGVLSSDNKFSSILNTINSYEKNLTGTNNEILPCKVFCELETNDINVRMTLIRSSDERKFFNASVNFRKSGPHNTSRGFLNYVLNSLPSHYSIWGIVNRTMCFTSEIEKGRADLLIEDMNCRSDLDRETEIESVLNNNYPESVKQILPLSVKCSTIGSNFRKGREYITGLKYRHDVFLSYSHENEKDAIKIFELLKINGFRCYLSVKNLKTGDDFNEEIRTSLCNSREVLILCSKQSAYSGEDEHLFRRKMNTLPP